MDERLGSLSNAFNEFDTVGRHQAPPDPEILKAIGLNHGLESAIADLVDNSIDASAPRILIRFVERNGLVNQLVVIDDGDGMTTDQIDAAMQLGGQPSRSEGSLGHFGMGLKAASFSQASLLTVLSRGTGGVAVGRRIEREPTDGGFVVEELDTSQVERALDSSWTDLTTETGTIVMWDQIRTFPKSRNRSVTSSFVESKVSELRHHLGLTFHRLLDQGSVTVEIDVHDADTGESGLPFEVEPIDPFAYARSGAGGYPKTLIAATGAHEVPLTCHIWPRSDSHRFKLAGVPIANTQGFYLYRHNRLLSPGGWGGVARPLKERRLARVAVDIESFEDAFQMSVEKAGVHMTADVVHAIETAAAVDSTTFSEYLADAEQAFRVSNKRSTKRRPVLPPGQGISPRTKRAVAREVECVEGEEPIRIRWRKSDYCDFVEVDREERTLWLNTDYREAILKGTGGGINDAPLVKALLYLLYEDIFQGAAFGSRDKDNVDLWGEILTSAVEDEVESYDD